MPQSLGIIGAGPRALGALEALARSAARPDVTLFDPCPHPGAGPNFDPDESPLGLLNIPVRAIDLAGSPVAGFPDFADWSGCIDPDAYPSRATLGAYLRARFDALAVSGPLRITHRRDRVTMLAPLSEGGWAVDGMRFDAVLLAPGQPATSPDEQLRRWRDHAGGCPATLMPVYPMAALERAAQGWAGKQVAIRGLGLSTLDALRLLSEAQGGRFVGGRYLRSGGEPARILPFSLNGLPPFPKPATAALDAALDPSEAETETFRAALDDALRLAPDQALQRLCEPLADAARRIGVPAEDWLRAEIASPGSQHQDDPVAELRRAIAMARGDLPPDAGHVVGALWRKWQNDLRRGFNPADPAPETAGAIIGFDEGLKRYSYGPPVSGAERLLALIEASLVDLRATDDPDIVLTSAGWALSEGPLRVEVPVMIDAVLPPPALDRLDDPLIEGLRRRGAIRPAGQGLGAALAPDGGLIDRQGARVPGLAALGRIALGSVIAVDSIHDCFGAAADRWAAGLAQEFGT